MKRLSGPLRGAGVGIVLLVLVSMPFFKGLFFWTELLPAIALVALAFALWIVGRRLGGLSAGVPGGVAGGALLALAGCYALQFAWAVYPRGNLDWLLRVIAGWFVFVIFRAEASERLRRVMAWALVVGASAVAVHGLVEFVGLRVMNHELFGSLAQVGLVGRMYTAFQYANTAAIYFMAALFLAIGLGVASGRVWVKGLVAGLGAIILLGFFFSVSRGAVVVVPFGFILLFVGLRRELWWSAFLLVSAAALPTLGAIGPVGTAAATQTAETAFGWIGIAAAVGTLLGLLVGLIGKVSIRRQLLMVAAAAVVGAIGLGTAWAGRPLLPKQAGRLADINFRTPNVVLRLTYDKDAMRMVADQPFGRGGWGWARSYRQYSTFNYTARETHNHFAQTAVEAGVPGLIALVAAMVAALWGAWRNRERNPLGWSISAGAALIALHSLIDFDLSYGGVWLALWTLMGVALSEVPRGKHEGAFNSGALASALIILVTSTALWQGARLYEEAIRLTADGQSEEARVVAVRAAAWDPLNSDALVKAAEHITLLRAVQVDPTNPEAWFKLSISHELRREWELGTAAAHEAVRLDPWRAQYLDKVVRLKGFTLLDELTAGRYTSALQLARDLLDIEKQWTERLATAAPDQKLWNANAENLDPGTLMRFAQARFLVGELEGAKHSLIAASKIGLLNTEAEVWLFALYEQQGDLAGMKGLENQPWVRFRNSNPVYRALSR